MVVAAVPQTDIRPLTIEDWLARPDDAPRVELIAGAFIEMPTPTTLHQWIVLELGVMLRAFAKEHDLGITFVAPLGVRLTIHNVPQPDVMFVAKARRSIIRRDTIHGAPDLVMEVLSPSNRRHDIVTKAALYADLGVPEYWLVDPDRRTVTVQSLIDGRYAPRENVEGEARSAVLPGFAVSLADLFTESFED